MTGRAERFPKTVEAVRRADELDQKLSTARFAIGDALILECGEPGPRGVNSGAIDRLSACAAELKRAGFPHYTTAYLRDLRATATRFPDAERSASISWSVHFIAGSPETLRAAEQKARAEGVALTANFARSFVKIRKREQERREADEEAPSASDAARAFRTACADARERAEDAMAQVEALRGSGSDVFVDEVQSVVDAWQRVADALRAAHFLEAAE